MRLVTHVRAVELAINAELAVPEKSSAPLDAMIGGFVNLAPATNSEVATNDYLASLRDERIRADRERTRARAREDLFEDHGMAWSWWADQGPDMLAVLSASSFEAMLDKMDSARKHRTAEQLSEQDSFAHILINFIETTTPTKHRAMLGLFREYLDHFQRHDLVQRLDNLSTPTSTDRQAEATDESSLQLGSHRTDENSSGSETT
ncbi:hypothetical protein BJF85_19040 [Saccharomonospora sp. CUA-673]|nr:hypothetical protein BJF85_19040 [Saccharomonospora sp. CUA-673]